jgi:hypothetical protein
MELCTIEDAFPNIGEGVGKKADTPYAGGKDGYSSREERRAAKKLRAKRIKGAAIMAEDPPAMTVDPDRPAVERMEAIDTVQKEKEAFALPVLPKASCLFSDTGTPKYFGQWAEDDVEEGFSSFSPSPMDDANYRLYPDFTKGDMLKGVEKAAGKNLPEPPINDQWKTITEAASYSAYYDREKTPPPKPSRGSYPSEVLEDTVVPKTPPVTTEGSKNEALLKRIDELMGRLDQLEKKNAKDSKAEILMFVGTGLFILVSFEIFTRR